LDDLEANLAKVETASSSLVSRSKLLAASMICRVLLSTELRDGRSAVSSAPEAFNASRGGDLRISGNQRKVECDGGRRDQAVTAFRNRLAAASSSLRYDSPTNTAWLSLPRLAMITFRPRWPVTAWNKAKNL
jgi:hypothetical protein